MEVFVIVTLFMVFAILSPGPDFIVVSKNALTYSRNNGFAAAIGVSFGALLLSSISILGLSVLILHSKILYNCIKLVGGSYLLYLSYVSLLSKKTNYLSNDEQNISESKAKSITKSMQDGLFVSILNPKALLFFTALFTLISGYTNSFWVKVSYGLEVTILYFIWFIILAYLVTHSKIVKRLQRIQYVTDKILGVFLLFLGFDILLSLLL